jgi:hypothetical protein
VPTAAPAPALDELVAHALTPTAPVTRRTPLSLQNRDSATPGKEHFACPTIQGEIWPGATSKLGQNVPVYDRDRGEPIAVHTSGQAAGIVRADVLRVTGAPKSTDADCVVGWLSSVPVMCPSATALRGLRPWPMVHRTQNGGGNRMDTIIPAAWRNLAKTISQPPRGSCARPTSSGSRSSIT